MSDFLTIEDIIGIHDMSISAYGGIYGIRDINLLKSAVSRPQCGYYNDIIEEGCALMESLIIRGCPACFLILKGVVISSHETNRFS